MTINILQSDESRTTSLYLQVFGKALKIRTALLAPPTPICYNTFAFTVEYRHRRTQSNASVH